EALPRIFARRSWTVLPLSATAWAVGDPGSVNKVAVTKTPGWVVKSRGEKPTLITSANASNPASNNSGRGAARAFSQSRSRQAGTCHIVHLGRSCRCPCESLMVMSPRETPPLSSQEDSALNPHRQRIYPAATGSFTVGVFLLDFPERVPF